MGLKIAKSLGLKIAIFGFVIFTAIISLLGLITQPAEATVSSTTVVGVTQIDNESSTSCATIRGAAYCWGNNEKGQLGDGTSGWDYGKESVSPVDTSGVLNGKQVTEVSVANSTACAVADGKAYCWGSNFNGRLGNGTTTDSSVPVAVDTTGVLANKTVTQVSVGYAAICAIADGKAYCWGQNNSGQLGNGTTTDSSVPVAVDTTGVLAGKTVTQVSAGSNSVCAIADGKAYCWGQNNSGQLGNGTTTDSSVPVAVDTTGVLAGKTVTQVSFNSIASIICAIADGKAYCWGGNTYGQLGNGTTTSSRVPVAVDTTGVLAGKTVTSVSAGIYSACAIADGKAYCWGGNGRKQLGDGTTTNSSVPVVVDTSGVLAGKTLTQVSAADGACVLSDELSAYCWGYGQLPIMQNMGGGVPPAPMIEWIYTPSSISITKNRVETGVSGTEASINGRDFDDNATVEIGGKVATVISRGETNIDIIIPASSSPGSVDIKVTNKDGQTGTLVNGVTYFDTVINSVTPNQVITDVSDTYMYISGSGFEDNSTVQVGDKQATVSYQGSSFIYAYAPASSIPGSVDIKITSPSGKVTTLVNGFTYYELIPQITQVSTAAGAVPTYTSNRYVSLLGKDFDGSASVTVDGIAVQILNQSSTSLNFYAPVLSAPGLVDIVVTNGNGKKTTVEDGLRYYDATPRIDVISPNSVGVDHQPAPVTIYGEDFTDGATVQIGGKNMEVITQGNDYIEFSVPAASTPQSLDVTVINETGKIVTVRDGFTYRLTGHPSIDKVSFSTELDRKIMTVTGVSLVGDVDQNEYVQALQGKSFVRFNDVDLLWCTEGTGATAEFYASIGYIGMTDDPQCYFLIDPLNPSQVGLTTTTAKIWLADDFDITAPGTVSVNGSADFAFNQPSSGGDDDDIPLHPTAKVNGKSLENTPQIPNRPTFSGTATPDAKVVVTVHSDPVSCTAIADTQGKWSCTLPTNLESGQHTVMVHVVNPDNSTEDLGPYTVIVVKDGTSSTIDTTTLPDKEDPTFGAPNTGFMKQAASFVMPATLILFGSILLAGVAVIYVGARRIMKN